MKAVEDREIEAIKKQEGGRAEVGHRWREIAANPGRPISSSSALGRYRDISGQAQGRLPGACAAAPHTAPDPGGAQLGAFDGHPMIEHFKFLKTHTNRRRR